MINSSSGINYQQQRKHEWLVHYMMKEIHNYVPNAMVNALNMIY